MNEQPIRPRTLTPRSVALPRRVIYVAHPVSGDVTANIARALRWLRWLMARDPEVAYMAPWIAAIMAGQDDGDPSARARGMADDLAMVRRCDGIVLVGGRLSPGMAMELHAAIDNGADVEDLTHLGEEP